ncbi:hypothetical protein [Arsenicicoccus cauae]|nr:hypothetical protein [Arsenicicoccus cauae]
MDPDLLYDSVGRREPTGQLSLVDLLRDEQDHGHTREHAHTTGVA